MNRALPKPNSRHVFPTHWLYVRARAADPVSSAPYVRPDSFLLAAAVFWQVAREVHSRKTVFLQDSAAVLIKVVFTGPLEYEASERDSDAPGPDRERAGGALDALRPPALLYSDSSPAALRMFRALQRQIAATMRLAAKRYGCMPNACRARLYVQSDLSSTGKETSAPYAGIQTTGGANGPYNRRFI